MRLDVICMPVRPQLNAADRTATACRQPQFPPLFPVEGPPGITRTLLAGLHVRLGPQIQPLLPFRNHKPECRTAPVTSKTDTDSRFINGRPPHYHLLPV